MTEKEAARLPCPWPSTRLPWRGCGVWLMGDSHVHHRQTGLARVVEEARQHGCDYLAFTEHSFYTECLKAQPELIERALHAHPDMILVTGVEWSSPAGDETRSEQVGVLMPGGARGMSFLDQFLNRFDTRVAGIKTSEEAFLDALRFLSAEGAGDVRPTVILTHPHRPQAAFTADQIRSARRAGPALAGLCGSSRPPKPGTCEVWPWVSDVGGTYDQLTADGLRLVILAESHFHQHTSEGGQEFWPGELRQNYVYCPDRSEAGLFQGLRSGASYFVLGDIVREVELRAAAAGESVMMGETLSARRGAPIEITVTAVENAHLDSMQLIGNPDGQPCVIARVPGRRLVPRGGRVRWRLESRAGQESFYVRARGSAHIEKPYPMTAWFYTNPLWVSTDSAVVTKATVAKSAEPTSTDAEGNLTIGRTVVRGGVPRPPAGRGGRRGTGGGHRQGLQQIDSGERHPRESRLPEGKGGAVCLRREHA